MNEWLYILLGFFGGFIFGIALLIVVFKRIFTFMVEQSKK